MNRIGTWNWMLDAGYWILDAGCWILDTGNLEHRRCTISVVKDTLQNTRP